MSVQTSKPTLSYIISGLGVTAYIAAALIAWPAIVSIVVHLFMK